MTQINQLEQLIEERKKQAKDKRLHEKIAVILHNFGHQTSDYDRWPSREHKTTYRSGKLLIQETTIGSTLSDSYGEYGSSSSTWREVKFGDRVVYYEDDYCEFGRLYCPIRTYVPGEWEELLERPYREIMAKRAEEKKQQREREKIERAEYERRRIDGLKRNFGL